MSESQVSTAGPLAGLYPAPRVAVSLLFLLNGFMVGAWAPKIPEFAERLSLSESTLGLMILVLGIGSLSMMPIAGMLFSRFGTDPVVKVMAIGLIPCLLLITYVTTIWQAAIAVFLFGGFMGAMDVAMNANAVSVEKAMGRAIMSSCHAFWSLGGLIGAATGGFLIAVIGVTGHAFAVTLFGILLLACAWTIVFHDRPQPREPGVKGGLPRTILPWLIGLMALFSMVPEGAVLDWGALYVRQEMGASVALSGFAFAAFSGTMAVMRFAGDFVRDRLGAVRTLRVCTVFAIIGMLIAAVAPSAELAIIGFALCGIGLSNMVPIAFSAAGNMPGLAPGVGLSVATFLGYSGMLFAPSLIGFLAEHIGFRPVFLTLPILLAVVLAASRFARHADAIRRD